MQFEFATAGRIVFGAGRARESAALAREYGTRVLVVTGRDATRAEGVLEALQAGGAETMCFAVAGEPDEDVLAAGVAAARGHAAQVVLALGGGSVLDSAKALAALVTNAGALLDYVEVVGRGQALSVPALPVIAVPTTAGTGAEVTRNAVVTIKAQRVKVSLRSVHMLPRAAVVDPTLTYDLPPALTAATGIDALTQMIEPYTCSAPNPLTDAVCRAGIPRAARALPRVYVDGHDAEARADMALASLSGGLALANAKLGAVHGFAGPLGGLYGAPHGALCAALLMPVLSANVRALRGRAPASPVLARYAEIAQWVLGDAGAVAEDVVPWAAELCQTLGVAGLAHYGVTRAAFPEIVIAARQASSMKGNPIVLTDEELGEVLAAAL